MNETKGAADDIVATAISIPISLVGDLANLLITKKVITRDEMVSRAQRLIDNAKGDHAEMERSMLKSALRVIEKDSGGSQ